MIKKWGNTDCSRAGGHPQPGQFIGETELGCQPVVYHRTYAVRQEITGTLISGLFQLTAYVLLIKIVSGQPDDRQGRTSGKKAVARTDEANVRPHDVLNGLQIALDEGFIGLPGQARCNLLGGFIGWLQTNPAVSSVLGRGAAPIHSLVLVRDSAYWPRLARYGRQENVQAV